MASIDSLSIRISASTSDAQKKVDALVKSLEALVGAIDKLDVSKFEVLSQTMNDLAQSFQGLKGAGVKQIEKAAKALKNIEAQKESFEPIRKGAEEVSKATQKISEDADKVSEGFNHIDSTSIDNVKASMQEVAGTLDKATEKMSNFKTLSERAKIVIPTEGLEKVNKRIENLNERIADLKDKLNFKSENQAGYVNSEEMEKDQKKIDGLINELDRLKLKKQELESNGGFKLNLAGTVDNLRKGFEAVNKKLDSFISKMRKAKSHTRDTSKSTKDFSVASMKLAKELTRVTKMLKLMITRMVLRKVIQGVIDGFKNLIQYSSEVNSSVSLVWNSFRQLGNSIAAAASPILNTFAPVINYLIQLLIKLVNVINQVISALSGRSTWTKAKTLSDDYGKSLDKSNKSAKELKKTILGFDEINQLQDNKDSGDSGMTKPEDMFEDAKIEAKWADMAQKLRNILNQLLAPIKKAWSKVGDQVVAAWTRAFKSVKKLLSDIGKDFLKVWNQPKTVAMLENILRIFRDIGTIIALLAENLDKAWNKNKTGLKILEGIRDIFAVVIQHVKNMTSATVLWAKELDFTPILEAFKNWVISMEPVVDAIAGAFEDFYRKVLLPLGKWTLEKGLPDLIDTFRRFNEEVQWDVIRERLNRVWEALEPFAETVGEGLNKFIGDVAAKIAGFLNSKGWDDFIDTLVKWTNEIDADDVARGLSNIFQALAAYKTVDVLTTIVDKVTKLSDVSKAGIHIAVDIVIAVTIAQWIFDKFLGFMQWIGKVAMENAGYTKVQIDIEMAWWTKFRENYGSMGGIGRLLADWISGDYKRKAEQFEVEAKVETLGIHEAEIQVEDLRKKTEDLGNSEGLQIFVEKANGSVEQLKDIGEVNFDPLKKSVEDVGKTVGDLAITVEKDTAAINKSASTLKFTPSSDESGKIKDITKQFDDLKISVEKDTSAIKKSTENINFTPLSDSASKMSDEVTLSFSTVDDAVETTSTTVDDSFGVITSTVDSGTKEILECTDSIKGAFTKDKWTFNGVAEGLGETFRKAKEAIKREWNDIADTLNGTHDVGSAKLKINLPRFAAGGFPEDGLFMANHNEMVGKFSNGRTAVANNEQITTGIAQAVYQAMMSANGGGNSIPVETSIYIGEEQVARAVTRGQRKMDRRYSPTMA